MVESQIVILVVAGSSPVARPLLPTPWLFYTAAFVDYGHLCLSYASAVRDASREVAAR